MDDCCQEDVNFKIYILYLSNKEWEELNGRCKWHWLRKFRILRSKAVYPCASARLTVTCWSAKKKQLYRGGRLLRRAGMVVCCQRGRGSTERDSRKGGGACWKLRRPPSMTNEKFTRSLMYRIVITLHEAACDYRAEIYQARLGEARRDLGSRSNRGHWKTFAKYRLATSFRPEQRETRLRAEARLLAIASLAI